jgi:hypothetical protein
MANMRCKIRSGTRRAQAKNKSLNMEDSIISRGGASSQGRSMYKFCTDVESNETWSSAKAPRFTSWRRED